MLGRKKTIAENILILGLGGVGAYLARRLVHEGYAVTAIEPDSNLIRYTDNHLDARLIQGSAMSMDCWREAHAENIDVLIAVTDNDAVNILASDAATAGIRPGYITIDLNLPLSITRDEFETMPVRVEEIDRLENAVVGWSDNIDALRLDMFFGLEQRVVVLHFERDVLYPGGRIAIAVHLRTRR